MSETINMEEFRLSPEKVAELQKMMAKASAPHKKKLGAEFVLLPLTVCRKLADEKANGAARTMIDALLEAWFNTGRHRQHFNPFPLDLCDTQKWGLTRMQRSRALKFLARIRLITVDRPDLLGPLVTLTWVPRYPPGTSRP
jgi:hypothetical protein